MRVKTLVKFKDLKEGKVREIGEVFEVDRKRFDKINSNTFGPLIEELKETKKGKGDGKTNG